MASIAQAKVDDKSPAVEKMAQMWAVCQPLLDGTLAMRAAKEALLPKWPNEDPKDYAFRLSVSVLFPAYKRTVATLTGKPFSEQVTLGEDMPVKLKDYCEDIDRQGRNLDAFAASVMEESLGLGLSGILVDYPPAEEAPATAATGVRTQADEAAAGLRPYFVQIHPQQILGWRAERVKGAWVLTMLRLMEEVEEPDGEFGTACVAQVRVLRPGSWETFRKSSATGEFESFKKGTTTLKQIPFVPTYGERVAFMEARPPLLDLAHLNIKHWQSQSDQDNLLHVARVPILVAYGVDSKTFQLVVGSQSCVKFDGSPTEQKLEYTEHTGQAIGAGKIALDDLKEEMRQAGAELLVLQPGEITATQVGTENAVGMCALKRITLDLQDALAAALAFMAQFEGLGDSGGTVKIFSDFGAATLAEASGQLLLQANTAGVISKETLFEEFQRRGTIAADRKWDEEQERVSEEGPPLGMVGIDPVTGLPATVQPPTPPGKKPPAPAPKQGA